MTPKTPEVSKNTHKSIEEFARAISQSVRRFCGNGQYETLPELEKAYLDGVETAIGMMYLDLTGTPKSKGMLEVFAQQKVQEALGEIEKLRHEEERVQQWISKGGVDYIDNKARLDILEKVISTLKSKSPTEEHLPDRPLNFERE